jgi:hypothetical protein
MEGICRQEIEKYVLGKRVLVHTHPDYEGMEGVAEKITENGVVIRSGTQLHEIGFDRLEPCKKTLSKCEVKDFEDWYTAKLKDWNDFYNQYKKEIVNKKEVIIYEFLSYLGILERKLVKSQLQKLDLSVADLYSFCVEMLKSKVAT